MKEFFRKLWCIRCFCCGESDGNLKVITWTESKSTDPKFFYHDGCLEKVMDNPNYFDSEVIDKCLQIIGAIRARQTHRALNIEKIKYYKDIDKKEKAVEEKKRKRKEKK